MWCGEVCEFCVGRVLSDCFVDLMVLCVGGGYCC